MEKFKVINSISGDDARKWVLSHVPGGNIFQSILENSLAMMSNSIKIYLFLDPTISFVDIHSEKIFTKITNKDDIAKFFLVRG